MTSLVSFPETLQGSFAAGEDITFFHCLTQRSSKYQPDFPPGGEYCLAGGQMQGYAHAVA